MDDFLYLFIILDLNHVQREQQHPQDKAHRHDEEMLERAIDCDKPDPETLACQRPEQRASVSEGELFPN